jgi:hypothetical protein
VGGLIACARKSAGVEKNLGRFFLGIDGACRPASNGKRRPDDVPWLHLLTQPDYAHSHLRSWMTCDGTTAASASTGLIESAGHQI